MWLIATHDLRPGSGQGHPSYALARRLAERGVDVHLVASRVAEDLARAAGVELHPHPQPRRSTVIGDLLLDRNARRVVRRLGVDPHATPIVAMGGNTAIGTINWVHYLHASWFPGRRPWWSADGIKHRILHVYEKWRERRALHAASLVIANSELTRSEVIRRVGLPPDRVRLVYYGTSSSHPGPITPEERRRAREALRIPPAARVAAFVGGLGRDSRKGFDTLIKAWQLRHDRLGHAAGLVLAAGPGDLAYWGRAVSSAGLDDSIRLLGYQGDVATVLAASDLLVSPTRYEPYGLNVHEAICRRIPALVTRAAGVAERYPPQLQSWLLDDPDDPIELGQAIAAVVDASDRAEGRQEALEQFARDLESRSWDDMADEIIRLWEEAVERSGRR